jgi:DNA repair exonuclease SbcCD ATPase subunit
MLFHKLKLNYFGKFQNKEIELKPGINLIYGENEAGKSTIHTFMKGMLFGIERLRGRGAASKEDVYTRYLPWDYPGAFSGSMEIKVGDREYRIQRSFHANDKSFTVTDLATGRELKLKEGMISEIIPGLTESTFKNTISIEQLKASTDTELAAQVRNYIANLSISKSKEVNVAKAVSYLSNQKKELEATLNAGQLKTIQSEIDEGLLREEKIDQLTVQLKELMAKEQELTAQREEINGALDSEEVKRMEQLPAILEKYRSYQELTRQCVQLEQQAEDLKAKISDWEKDRQSVEELREDINQVKTLKEELLSLEKSLALHQGEQEELKLGSKRNYMITIIPSAFLAVLMIAITGAQPFGIITAALAIILGIISVTRLNSNTKKKQLLLDEKYDLLRKQNEAVKGKLQELFIRNHAADLEGLMNRQEQLLKQQFALEHGREQLTDIKKRQTEVDDNRDTLYEVIMKYMQNYISEEELTTESMQRLREVIRLRKQEVTGKQIELERQAEALRLRIEKIKWDLSTMEGNEEQLLKNKVRLNELEQKQKETAVELEAIKLALSTIQSLSTDIHDSFGQQLNQAVSEVISEVTEQKYKDIKVDEKLDVKVGWNGDYVLLDKLSAGTIDQMYFALRLAIADLLLGKDEIPLLLDDSFALYDENRVMAALRQIADRKQIILFSCHKREQKLLEELKLPFHFVNLND